MIMKLNHHMKDMWVFIIILLLTKIILFIIIFLIFLEKTYILWTSSI